MKLMVKKIGILFLCMTLTMTIISVSAYAKDTENKPYDMSSILKNYQQKDDLSIWEMVVLEKNKIDIPQEKLQSLLDQYEKAQGQYRLVTDHDKLAIVLRAMSFKQDQFGSYPFLSPIYQHENLGKQGVNGYIFSLIALTGESLPSNAIWTQDKIIDEIMSYQNADGGFSLSKTAGESDVDITAMVITAFSFYQQNTAVKEATQKAIAYLASCQGEDGNFTYQNASTSESVSQVIMALTSMHLSLNDSRFVKNGQTLLDVLQTYLVDDAHFSHTKGGMANDMATEQAAMALTAYNLSLAGENSFYQLPVVPLSSSLSFCDVKPKDWFYDAVMFVAEQKMTSGVSEGIFAPNMVVTRGQFIKMACDAYAISPRDSGDNFYDAGYTWYTPYLAAVKQTGISQGVGNNQFHPEENITREEMFTLLYQILKSIHPESISNAVQEDLSRYADEKEISSWAKDAFSYFVSDGIVKGDQGLLNPKAKATRAQMAQIFYSMLKEKKVG